MKPRSCFDCECPCRNMGNDFSEVEVGAGMKQHATYYLLERQVAKAEAREGLPFRPYAQAGLVTWRTHERGQRQPKRSCNYEHYPLPP